MASHSILVATSSKCSTNENDRPVAKYHPSIWADRFVPFASSSLENSRHNDSYSKKVQVLKQKVRDMLLNKVSTTMEKITLINSLCRLGVSYHFEEEIEAELKHVFDAGPNLCMSDDYDLYTCALVFMVFRQHGFRMSCEIFDKFKDGDGNKLKETLSNDIRGMLSLYEASHLRVHGEAILDEALVFTTTRLESFARDHPSHALAKQVLQALNQPLFRGIPRLETRRFISFYQEDETHDAMLLAFAKLDFNLLQLLHQHELGQVQKWWKDSKIPLELSYVRDRIAECYFWMLGVYYEPQYSRARMFLTKVTCMATIIDDTYDGYATFKESRLLTDAIQRWEAKALDQLPKYMHVIYNTLLSLYGDMEKEEREEGRSYSVNYAKEAMKQWVRFQCKEVEWLNRVYIPSFEEHIETSTISIGAPILACSSFVGIEMEGTQIFDWLKSRPICVKSCGIIVRLMDDIAGHKFELERKHIATTVQCYMKQYGVSVEEVVVEFGKRVEHAWKDLNEECLSPGFVSKHAVMQIHKLTRTGDVVYRANQDRFTSSKGDMKRYITLLFIDPISVNDSE